jgi:2-polyprenyl-3-methyl-5-hydroxy-6-metoxy-1,4-benzoquinol methylase
MELIAPVYWEERARRFAHEGAGLAAVCSYGMPGFYNASIHICQQLALSRWLAVAPGTKVLDVGCGVGRWSRQLARRGALVTGVDLSPTMVAEAGRRAAAEGVGDRCTFRVADLTELDLPDCFSLVLGVTVLQHILAPGAMELAVRRLAQHLAPGGRLVLLEAAPTERIARCDTPVFQARDAGSYCAAFANAGLEVACVTGVDPAPFKTWLLPHYRRLPRPVAIAALAAVTGLSLPIDVIAGRASADASWHKVFVASRIGEGDASA